MYNLIIIEDNRSALDMISKAIDFAEFGFSVAGLFRDGEKALEFIKNNKVDACITDIKMPKMDGTQFAKICHESFPKLKIIFLSAFRNFEYARIALKNNVFDYLTKPIDIDEFHEVLTNLKKYLDKKNTSLFNTKSLFYERQNIFEGIKKAKLKNDEIIEELKSCGIDIKNESPNVALLRFSIPKLEEYLNNFWVYGLENLYVAIYNFIPKDTQSTYYSVTDIVYTEFKVVIIDDENEALEKKVDDFKEQFINNVKSFLNLEIECASIETSSSLNAIVSQTGNASDVVGSTRGIVKDILIYIAKHYNENISLSAISKQFYLSPSYLSVLFKKETNKNFIDYLTEIRMSKVADYLINSNKPIDEIFSLVGYSNKSHFYKTFKSYFGQTPKDYRKKQRNG